MGWITHRWNSYVEIYVYARHAGTKILKPDENFNNSISMMTMVEVVMVFSSLFLLLLLLRYQESNPSIAKSRKVFNERTELMFHCF